MTLSISTAQTNPLPTVPTTLMDYHSLHAAACEKFKTLPDHSKLEVISCLLGIPLEQLPVVKSHYTPEDNLCAIQKNMAFEVMKGGYRNATRNTFSITSIFVQGESPDTIFKIHASQTSSTVIQLSKFKLSGQKYELCWCEAILSSTVPTQKDRWVIDQSPLFKSQVLTETLMKHGALKDPLGIMMQYCGYCPKGWFEDYADIFPLLPSPSRRSKDQNEFEYLYSLKQKVEQVFKDICAARKKAAWVQHHLAWYEKASGILHEMVASEKNSNGDILRPLEKRRLQEVIRIGDQGFRDPSSFLTKTEMNAYYSRIASRFQPFISTPNSYNTFASDVQKEVGADFQLPAEEPTDAEIANEAGRITKIINSYLSVI